MLTGLLSGEECAECRICCEFGDDDLWETPFADIKTRELIKNVIPDCDFFGYEGIMRVGLIKEEQEGLYLCRVLGKKGCKLGDNKPFDCKIWPFRVMDLNGRAVLTLSPVCPAVMKKPLVQIVKKGKEIAPLAFSYAKNNPQTVRKYIDGYPIILCEQ